MGGTAALIVKWQKNNVDIKHKYVSEKKQEDSPFPRNFPKCRPIFKVLSRSFSALNV